MTLKRLTMLRTSEDIATRDLYRLIYTHEENTRYEDVKDCLDRGAKLTGIEASYGIPLLFAIRSGCDISIIKLLVDSGGCDLQYTSIDIDSIFIWEDEEEGQGVIDASYLYTLSIQNVLIRMYHKAIGTFVSIINQVVNVLYKQGYIDRIIYEKETPEQIHQPSYEYVKQCCELVGLDFETIKMQQMELRPDIQSFRELDMIPNDKHPYNWNHTLDVYNIENNIEDSENESESNSI